MLEPELVYSSYPASLRPFRRNLLREYLQCKTLQYLASSVDAAKLIWIGGTTLRIAYGGDRFSEDLDFDDRGLTETTFAKMGELVAGRFALENVTCQASLRGEPARTIRLRFPHILQQWRLTRHRDEVLLLKLDAEPQGCAYPVSHFTLNRLDTFAFLPIAPAEVILAQKLVAILRRPRAMDRDFYDAAFLWGRTRPDLDFLTCRLGISAPGELRRLLLERWRMLDLKALAADLQPFLADPSLAGRVEAFPEILCSTLA
jgi:predicted nucleotidyltransferase component of viral defense system